MGRSKEVVINYDDADWVEASNLPLTHRERIFVESYLVTFSATDAAKAAGFTSTKKSIHGCGHRLKRQPNVARAIEERLAERAEKYKVTKDRVLQELARISFTNMTDVAKWNESGVTLLESSELGSDVASAVQEVSETMNQHGGSRRVKLHDKTKALEILAKHLNLFGEPGEAPSGGAMFRNLDLEKLGSDEILALYKKAIG